MTSYCDAENISLWRKEVEELQILESAMKRAYVAVNGVEQDRAHHQISAVVERLQLLERKLKVARDGCGPHDTVGFDLFLFSHYSFLRNFLSFFHFL